jgi:hypothetical protein
MLNSKTGEAVVGTGVVAWIMGYAPAITLVVAMLWWGMRIIIDLPKFLAACRRLGFKDRRKVNAVITEERRK